MPFFRALDLDQRPVFATAIATGLRKGELCGCRKDDIDLKRRLIFVRRSYDRPIPKGNEERVVPIPEALVPFLEQAIDSAPGPLLFPDESGSMRTPFWQPEDILRRALKRGGVVTSYTHVCRRKGCGYSADRQDATIEPCPRCGFKLWPKGNVRKIRFHDLRHTYATLLLMFGAQPKSVQKLLGHADPRTTDQYVHLLPDFMSQEVNRLQLGIESLTPARREDAGIVGKVSQSLSEDGSDLGIPLVSTPETPKVRGRNQSVSRAIPASYDTGCMGFEPMASAVTGPRYNQLN